MQQKTERFTFRLTSEELIRLGSLARFYQRTRSDTVRLIVNETARQLGVDSAAQPSTADSRRGTGEISDDVS